MKKIFIGEYTEKDLKDGRDKKEVEAAKKKNGLAICYLRNNKKAKFKNMVK